MQSVGRKTRRGHGRGHRKHENGDRPSEMRPIMRTVRQKFSIGNVKMATVRQKCIASQHRERENEYRSSEILPIMRNNSTPGIRKWRPFLRNSSQASIGNTKRGPFVGNATQNVYRCTENAIGRWWRRTKRDPFVRNSRDTKCHESRWKSKFFDTENATLAQKGVAPSSGGHAGQTRT